ncbi:MAG: methyl-accepting chemotaxis protein [Pseudomonadota bacterium]
MFRDFSIHRLCRMIAWVLACGTILVLFANIYLMSAISDSEQAWEDYEATNSPRAQALSAIVESMGYGGMIHNFKNAVIRLDIDRTIRAREAAGAALQALQRYRQQTEPGNNAGQNSEDGHVLPKATTEELLLAVEQTVRAYADNLQWIEEMIREGTTPTNLDSVVKIDDGPALAALQEMFAREKQDGEKKIVLLGELRRALGYGGLIHNFKNYVLRNDEPRIAKIRGNAAQANEILSKYRAMDTSPAEQAAITEVSSMVAAYEAGLDTAITLVRQGASVAEIDANVKVSDGPALAALSAMETYIAEETAARAGDISVQMAHARTVALILAVFSTIGMLLVAIGIRWALLAGVARPAGTIAVNLKELAQGNLDADPSDLIADTEVGEIARSAKIFRESLIENRRLMAESERMLQESKEAAEVQKRLSDAQAEAVEEQKRLMEEREEAEQALQTRQEQLDALLSQLESVVAAGIEGDFSQRLAMVDGQEDLSAIASSLNQLLGTVDAGIESISSVANRFASGDLTATMDGKFLGRFQDLRRDFDSAFDRVSGMMGSLRDVADKIADESTSISSASMSLSTKTEQQAQSLERTSGALEDLASAVNESAKDTAEVETVVKTAAVSASQSGHIVIEAVEAMERIEATSKEITKIITVIDEISFQTNLLALNAGVEAARAGEAGRGFAVVASEVRALAQRASDAASDINALIQKSGKAIEEGVRLVKDGGESIQNIVGSMDTISERVGKVAALSRDQATGIADINSTLASIDDGAKNYVSVHEETTAATMALNEETKRLIEAISAFQIRSASRQSNWTQPGQGRMRA